MKITVNYDQTITEHLLDGLDADLHVEFTTVKRNKRKPRNARQVRAVQSAIKRKPSAMLGLLFK